MEKISEIICWAIVVVLALFAAVYFLTRGLAPLVSLELVIAQSPQPWWVLALAALALVAGFFYLLRSAWARRRIHPHSGSRS